MLWREILCIPLHVLGIPDFLRGNYIKCFVHITATLHYGTMMMLLPLSQFVANIHPNPEMQHYYRKFMSIFIMEVAATKFTQTKHLCVILALAGEIPGFRLIFHYITWSLLEDPPELSAIYWFLENERSVISIQTTLRHLLIVYIVAKNQIKYMQPPDDFLPIMLLWFAIKRFLVFVVALLSYQLFTLFSYSLLSQFYLLRIVIDYNTPSLEKLDFIIIISILVCVFITIITTQPW